MVVSLRIIVIVVFWLSQQKVDTPLTCVPSSVAPPSILCQPFSIPKVEIYTISDSADGANFQRQDGFSWEPDPDNVIIPTINAHHLGLDLDLNQQNDLDTGFFVSSIRSSDGHLLFIMHVNGVISVWNWRKKEIVYVLKYYRTAQSDYFFDPLMSRKWGMDGRNRVSRPK